MMKKDNSNTPVQAVDVDNDDNTLVDPQRRETLEKLVKYTPPAMLILLTKDSAWAQMSGGAIGPPPPPPQIPR